MSDRLWPDGIHVIESSVAARYDVVMSSPRMVAPVSVALTFRDAVDDAVTAACETGLTAIVDGKPYFTPEEVCAEIS